MSKFPIGRTCSGDYGFWKPLYHFKALAVNIMIDFTNYVLSEFGCFVGPIIKQEKHLSLHIWGQRQVTVG